ncbi:hypothetical protein D3C71_23800 [compost metagenome]
MKSLNNLLTSALRSMRRLGAHALTAVHGGYQPSFASKPTLSQPCVAIICGYQGWFNSNKRHA